MSRGIGNVGNMVLAVMAHYHVMRRDHWWHDHTVSRIARGVVRLTNRELTGGWILTEHRAGQCAGDTINIGRVLAGLERRGLVTRFKYGSGSEAWLTPTGIERGMMLLTKFRTDDEAITD